MKMAILEAKKAEKIGEVPVGAVIVFNNKIVSSGFNQSIKDNDPTCHAEVAAIRNAAKKLKNYRLTGANIYVTLEPCAMCYGAIIHSRISNIYFGASDPKSGVCGSCEDFNKNVCFNHRPEIYGRILENECSDILRNFFKKKRS